MMVRKAFMGMGLVVCLLVATASMGWAERIEVQVYENEDPNNPLARGRLLEGVEVTLWWLDSPEGPVPVASQRTNPEGNVVFEGVGEEAPGQPRIYEVRLATLDQYVPQPEPGQTPEQAAAGLPYVVRSVFKTEQPSPTPMPQVNQEVSQDPPRNGRQPSSGALPTMGTGGTQRAEFPAAKSEPEDGSETFAGFIQGLVFRDVGNNDGIYVEGIDEPVEGANVEIEYRDPFAPTSQITTPANGRFFNLTTPLATKADGTPPDVFIRVRATPNDPWSEFRKVPITIDPLTQRLEYLLTATRYSVGAQAPSASIAGQVIQDGAPGNGQVDAGEAGAEGEPVELRNAATDDLIASATSGSDGAFEFLGVEAGTYKVMVPGVVMRVVAVAADEAVTGADLVLPYVAPAGSIAGRVVQDEAPGNGQADPGEAGVSGKTVELRSAGDDSLVDSTTSAGDGSFAFADVADGSYRVMVPGEVMRTLDLMAGQMLTGADLVLPVVDTPPPGGGGDDCTPDNCHSGALHEVLLETDMWVGATPTGFDIRATLRESCGATSPVIDTAQISYVGLDFPGDTQGLDEVVTIEDVRMQPGTAWATVRFRLTAATGAFPDGSFGNTSRRLELEVNGRTSLVCWRFLCDTTRAGGRVGLCRVVSTLSREAWASCTGFEVPVDPQPPSHKPTPPTHKPTPKPICKPVACAPCKPKVKVWKPKPKVKTCKPTCKKKAWKAKSWSKKNKSKTKRHKKQRRSWARWRRR